MPENANMTGKTRPRITAGQMKAYWDKVQGRRDSAIALAKELIEAEEETCNEFHSLVHKQHFRLHRSQRSRKL
jgi:hypothetical protein